MRTREIQFCISHQAKHESVDKATANPRDGRACPGTGILCVDWKCPKLTIIITFCTILHSLLHPLSKVKCLFRIVTLFPMLCVHWFNWTIFIIVWTHFTFALSFRPPSHHYQTFTLRIHISSNICTNCVSFWAGNYQASTIHVVWPSQRRRQKGVNNWTESYDCTLCGVGTADDMISNLN